MHDRVAVAGWRPVCLAQKNLAILNNEVAFRDRAPGSLAVGLPVWVKNGTGTSRAAWAFAVLCFGFARGAGRLMIRLLEGSAKTRATVGTSGAAGLPSARRAS